MFIYLVLIAVIRHEVAGVFPVATSNERDGEMELSVPGLLQAIFSENHFNFFQKPEMPNRKIDLPNVDFR